MSRKFKLCVFPSTAVMQMQYDTIVVKNGGKNVENMMEILVSRINVRKFTYFFIFIFSSPDFLCAQIENLH